MYICIYTKCYTHMLKVTLYIYVRRQSRKNVTPYIYIYMLEDNPEKTSRLIYTSHLTPYI